MLPAFYVDTNNMKALMLPLVMSLSLVNCSHANPITVSQQAMNANMLERVKAEGAKACGSDGGLKGITWAYNSIPGGNHLAKQERSQSLAVKYNDLPNPIQAEIRKQENPNEYDVGIDMVNLSAAAPEAYSFASDIGTKAATYICTDGAENPSITFMFRP